MIDQVTGIIAGPSSPAFALSKNIRTIPCESPWGRLRVPVTALGRLAEMPTEGTRPVVGGESPCLRSQHIAVIFGFFKRGNSSPTMQPPNRPAQGRIIH